MKWFDGLFRERASLSFLGTRRKSSSSEGQEYGK